MTLSKSIKFLPWAILIFLGIMIPGFVAYQSYYKGTDKSLSSNVSIGSPFKLLDHNGEIITEKAFDGHPIMVFFGFTHCPEVCPTTLFEISNWLEELGDEGASLRAFYVSIDPERDTPEIMKEYVENFSDRITGITGNPKDVYKLAKSWYVYWKKVPDKDDPSNYNMDHTASVYLVNAKGKFKGTIAYGEDTNTALEKLRRLARSKP